MYVTKKPIKDISNAGNGLFASEDIQTFTTTGIYTSGEHLSSKQIRKSTYKSDYAVQVHNLISDGHDKKRKTLTCNVACINDCMDPSKANCE